MCPWLDFGLSLNQSFFFAFSRWMVNGDRELLEPREDKTTSRGFDFIKYLTKQNHQSKVEKKRSRKPFIKSNDLKKLKKKNQLPHFAPLPKSVLLFPYFVLSYRKVCFQQKKSIVTCHKSFLSHRVFLSPHKLLLSFPLWYIINKL